MSHYVGRSIKIFAHTFFFEGKEEKVFANNFIFKVRSLVIKHVVKSVVVFEIKNMWAV